MDSHKITAAEEMYMLTISLINSQNPTKPVPISSIAEELKVQPVSANQMIKKMAEEGWVDYLPYKGVSLTDRGSMEANRVLWSRRLWEVFLVRNLGIPLQNAEIIACDFEHYASKEVIERLDEFLDYPEFCYHGKPIPRQLNEKNRLDETFSLLDLKIGTDAVVIEINTDAALQSFLVNEGVHPGVRLSIIGIGNDGDYLLECVGRRVHISKKIAKDIIVRKESQI